NLSFADRGFVSGPLAADHVKGGSRDAGAALLILRSADHSSGGKVIPSSSILTPAVSSRGSSDDNSPSPIKATGTSPPSARARRISTRQPPGSAASRPPRRSDT